MNLTDLMTRTGAHRVVPKTWGREIWLQADGGKSDSYCGKILEIRRGASGSLHFHPRKRETMWVLRGKVRIEMGIFPVILRAGDSITIPACVPHRLTGLSWRAARVAEFSTPHDDDDVVRIEESPDSNFRVGPDGRGRIIDVRRLLRDFFRGR